ncbi:MAG TPA: response regulator transcription factor [Chitinophagaceae bacterium]|jgi:DNA-binding NarL/FixJ family response regulator|nr:response regulator transcription factor [Chitinophagaceae bacterium]
MIHLAIIEDNATYRKALETLIQTAADIEIVHCGDNLLHITDTFRISKPDVVIMDIDLPQISGIEGIKIIKDQFPEINIFMLTVFEDEEKIFQSIKAGALGYLLKKDQPDKILDAIRAIHRGESVMNGQIARKILDYFSAKNQKTIRIDEYNLTKREKEILLLLIDGLSYKDIATRCFISMDTLFSHIRKIYTKLNMHSRAEIAARFR